MNLTEFIKEVFEVYPPVFSDRENENKLIQRYYRTLNTGKKYNYDSALTQVLRTCKAGKTPDPAKLFEICEKNILEDYEEINRKLAEIEAAKGTLFLEKIYGTKNGIEYEFCVPQNQNRLEARADLVNRGFTGVRFENNFSLI